MYYRNIEEIIGDEEFDYDHISVLPLEHRHLDQVRRILLEELPDDFLAIDESWVNSLMEGYERRHSEDIDQKYKLIFTATDRNDRVLGIVGATPKKGEPVKLMPFVALETPAFFALLADVPALLREHEQARKVYVHIIPDSEQTRFLQRSGWHLDGVLPDAYQIDRVTQQWSQHLYKDQSMRHMRLKSKYLQMMKAGRKTLEVRVAYENLRDLNKGEQVRFTSRHESLVKDIFDVRRYVSFDEMLRQEDYRRIVPDLTKSEVAELLAEFIRQTRRVLELL